MGDSTSDPLHGSAEAEDLARWRADDCAQLVLVRTRAQRHRARRYARFIWRGHRLACGEVHSPGLSRWAKEEEDEEYHDEKQYHLNEDRELEPTCLEEKAPSAGGECAAEGLRQGSEQDGQGRQDGVEACHTGPEPASDGPDDGRDSCPKHDMQSGAAVDEGPVMPCAAAGNRLMTRPKKRRGDQRCRQ